MKIYFAGIPGGNQKIRERVLYDLGVRERLLSFYYFDQLMIYMEEVLEKDNENLLHRLGTVND